MKKIKHVTDEDKILEMAAKIERNKVEDKKYQEQYSRFLKGEMSSNEFLNVGSNPNVIKILSQFNINSKAKIIKLNQSDLKNALLQVGDKTKKHTDGHAIPQEELFKLSQEIREPVMVLRGHNKNPDSIVLITEMKNDEGKNVLVPISLNRENGVVNRITTIFSKNNVINYINSNKEGVLAINKEKVDKLITDIGFQSPKSSVIYFDNSIAYTTENVTKVYEKYLEMFGNEKNKIADTEQVPDDLKSPGHTPKTQPTNNVSANKIIGKEKDTVNNQIMKDLKNNGFLPSSGLVNNMKKLHELVGNQLSIADVSNMYSGIKNPEIQDIVKSIAEECAQQEKARKVPTLNE